MQLFDVEIVMRDGTMKTYTKVSDIELDDTGFTVVLEKYDPAGERIMPYRFPYEWVTCYLVVMRSASWTIPITPMEM